MPATLKPFSEVLMSERELIDVATVAKMLGGLHPDTVRKRLTKRPDFPRLFRIGTCIMFDKPEILEWIECQRQAPDGRRSGP
jgi:predicted DNA-binding transcriptional regulator AlpA